MSDSAKEEVKAAEQFTETAGETKMEVDAPAKATTHDLSVPKIEGKTEAEVEELLAKAAKQGECEAGKFRAVRREMSTRGCDGVGELEGFASMTQ